MALGRLRFDETAFSQNYHYFRDRTAGETGAVVKADAYGTGAPRTVRILEREGCQHYFVASYGEAKAIHSYTSGKIYVLMGPQNAEEAELIASHGWIPILNSASQIRTWHSFRDQPAALHIDTGMHRLGVPVAECGDLELDGYNLCLILTHLACADDPEDPENRVQLDLFTGVAKHFSGIPTSIGNSAGILLGEEFQGSMTRPGLGLFGGNPWSKLANPMQPVITCEGLVVQIRSVPAGETVGYGGTYSAPRDMRVATVGLGYADGIPCNLSNRGYVVFDGPKMPIVGRVTMDSTQVDCTEQPLLREGDFVQFIGPDVPVDEVARLAGTISYEILTGLGNRFEFR